MSELKNITFPHLVEEATREIHSALLTEGAKGMRSSIHKWMFTAIQWNLEKKEIKKRRLKNEKWICI